MPLALILAILITYAERSLISQLISFLEQFMLLFLAGTWSHFKFQPWKITLQLAIVRYWNRISRIDQQTLGVTVNIIWENFIHITTNIYTSKTRFLSFRQETTDKWTQILSYWFSLATTHWQTYTFPWETHCWRQFVGRLLQLSVFPTFIRSYSPKTRFLSFGK